MKKMIKSVSPSIKRKDLEYVLECMIAEKLEYGDFAKRFEAKLAERINCAKAFAIDSFQNTIDLVLDAVAVDEGDEVILPSFAPQIYLDVILKRKAVPVPVDFLDRHSFVISRDEIERKVTENTKALIMIYFFGYTYDTATYADLAPYMIEDITSVIGARTGDKPAGTLGTYAIADFSEKSLITTGKGGAIFCGSRKHASLIKKHLETGKEMEPPEEGESYTPRSHCLMPDLTAAMGVSQLESLKKRLKLRRAIGEIYEKSIGKSRNSFIHRGESENEEGEEIPLYYSNFPLIIKKSLKDSVEFLKKNKIEAVRPINYPIHQLMGLPKEDFPNTESFYLSTLLLPLYSSLLKREVDHITKVLSAMI